MTQTNIVGPKTAALAALLHVSLTATPLAAANDTGSQDDASAMHLAATATSEFAADSAGINRAWAAGVRPDAHRRARLTSGKRRTGPWTRVSEANRAARMEPALESYVNAMQVYAFEPGRLYRLYAAVGRITDIALEPGEQLIDTAAGDTLRWVVGDTTSGTGKSARTHILIKPTAAHQQTNLLITTNRRVYHLDLVATHATWMASLSWRYPQTELPSRSEGADPAKEAASLSMAQAKADSTPLMPVALDFGYRIEGPDLAWKPRHVYNDGTRTILQFADVLGAGEAAPLFVIGEGEPQLVNYRQLGNRLIADRLFDIAELRLGKARVRITRTFATSARATGDGQ